MTLPPRLCVEHGILVSARRNRATRISSESAAPPFTQLKGPRPTYRGAQQETCPQHAPRSAPKGSRPDSASGIVFHAAPRPRPGAGRRRGVFCPPRRRRGRARAFTQQHLQLDSQNRAAGPLHSRAIRRENALWSGKREYPPCFDYTAQRSEIAALRCGVSYAALRRALQCRRWHGRWHTQHWPRSR